MLINFDHNIKTLDGKDLLEKATPQDEGKPITFSKLIVDALMSVGQDEPSLAGQEKFARFALASKIFPGGDVNLTVDELKKIKDLVGKYGSPVSVGQIWEHIEEPIKNG